MINYPAAYNAIAEEEMVYVEGGDALDLFDYFIGNYMRDQVLSGVRGAVWNSVKQRSIAPAVSWWESINDMSLLGHALFLYGCFLVYTAAKAQWEKE